MVAIAQIPERMYRDELGLPYERGGRGPHAYDCVGIMECVLRRYFKTKQRLAPDDASPSIDSCAWQPVEALAATALAGCVILTQDQTGDMHVYTVLDRSRCISASERRGVFLMSTRLAFHGAVRVWCYRYCGATHGLARAEANKP